MEQKYIHFDEYIFECLTFYLFKYSIHRINDILLIDSYFSYLFTPLYNTKLIKLENIFIL